MKRLTTKILTIAACAAMMLTAAPLANTQSVQAAVKAQGTVDLTTQKLSIPKGVKTAMVNKTVTMVKARRYQVKAKFGTTVVKSNATWKSSKPAVATVSTTGLITAKAPGTATIKVTYGKKSQTFKVKVVASHTHSWKTISKSTCATKGKKLCKTCGATGTTALSKTHNFKVTKKATCETKGVETCVDCGLKNALPKTAHKYVTETWEKVEGRGKPYYVDTMYCNGCGIDMTNWSLEKTHEHQLDIEGMQAGTANMDCFNAGYNGAGGVERYPKYVMAHNEETYCKTCGAHKALNVEDLYEVYYDEWRNVVRKSDNKILEESVWYKKAKPYLEKAKELEESKNQGGTTTASVRKATAKAVASPQDVITDVPNSEEINADADNGLTVSDNAEIATEIVSDNTVISDNQIVSDNSLSENETVSDNSTDITDLETGGDSVFKDTDSIVIEKTDDNDGIIIEDNDDTDDGITIEDIDDEDTEEDDGNSDYDGAEGDVIEDE